MKPNQLLLSHSFRQSLEHGGEVSVGKRKTRRPVVTRRPMHLVLRSTLARGEWSFLSKKHCHYIFSLIQNLAKKYDLKVYEYSNVGNHLHLAVKARTRTGLQNFLRVLAGKIAQRITRAVKGKPFGKRFWSLLAYSRVVEWGRAFLILKKYIQKNTLEALGLIPHERPLKRARYPQVRQSAAPSA